MPFPDHPTHPGNGLPKPIRRNISGVLLLDKPPHLSSNQALQAVRRLFMARKAGHTGTLDPMATGLLPICLGEATKFSSALLDAGKTYEAALKLGYLSTTGDAEGAISPCNVPVASMQPSWAHVESVLQRFVGPIMQTPPMYSALKHEGTPLYRYARAGLEIARAPRPIVIHALQATALVDGELHIAVSCSAGTYVRTLAEDIGRTLGCGGAYLTALRRSALHGFTVSQAHTLPTIEAMQPEERDACLLPPETLLKTLPAATLGKAATIAVIRGQAAAMNPAEMDFPEGMKIRLYDGAGNFLGVGITLSQGRVAPKRLINRED